MLQFGSLIDSYLDIAIVPVLIIIVAGFVFLFVRIRRMDKRRVDSSQLNEGRIYYLHDEIRKLEDEIKKLKGTAARYRSP